MRQAERDIGQRHGLTTDERTRAAALFNTQRLLEPLGYLPSAEFDAQLHRARGANVLAGALT